MAVTAFWYGNAHKALGNKEIEWDADTIKVMMTTSLYTPDQDLHDYKDDVTNEVSGTGYTAGGEALTSKTLVYSGVTNTVTYDAADVTWSGSSITARYAVIYDATPATDATRPLMGYVDFGTNYTSVNGAFSISWAATGIFTVTVS